MTKRTTLLLVAVFILLGTGATVVGVLSIPRLHAEIAVWRAFRKCDMPECEDPLERWLASMKNLGDRAEGPLRRRLYNTRLDERKRWLVAAILMDMGNLRPGEPLYDEVYRYFCWKRAQDELEALLKRLVAVEETVPLKQALEQVCRQAGVELVLRAPDDAVEAPVGETWEPLEEALDELTSKTRLRWYANVSDDEHLVVEIVVLTRKQAVEAFQAVLDAPLPAGSKTLNDAFNALAPDVYLFEESTPAKGKGICVA